MKTTIISFCIEQNKPQLCNYILIITMKNFYLTNFNIFTNILVNFSNNVDNVSYLTKIPHLFKNLLNYILQLKYSLLSRPVLTNN